MLKMYRKIGGNNGSALLSMGAGLSQATLGLIGFEIEPLKTEINNFLTVDLIIGSVILL